MGSSLFVGEEQEEDLGGAPGGKHQSQGPQGPGIPGGLGNGRTPAGGPGGRLVGGPGGRRGGADGDPRGKGAGLFFSPLSVGFSIGCTFFLL